MKRRHRALAALVAVAVGASIGVTGAAFSDADSSPSNTFNAAADWSPPTASPTTIQKTQGGVENQVKQGGTYHVYAQVTDNGNPPAGVAAAGVTANVSAITTGQTAVALTSTGGPWTVNGTSYNRRTAAQLTATNPLAAGSKNWTVTSADTNTPVNSGTSGNFSTTVDNTQPSASDIQINDSTGTNDGVAEINDDIIFTFSEKIEPASILAGWSGASTNVVVRLNNVGGADTVQIWNAANGAQLPLTNAAGITLGRTDYTTANRTFGLAAAAQQSTMVMNVAGDTISINMGTASGAVGTAAGTGSAIWTPLATPYDVAANAMSTTARTETGTADREF